MGYEERFELLKYGGHNIYTTVTSDDKEIEKHLSSFLYPSYNCSKEIETRVIGFDAEWFLFERASSNGARSKCATLQFCSRHMCLIIQLNRLGLFETWKNDSVHKSLLNFLRHPNLTFVGIGVKDNFAKLEKHYGIGCRNAVELGPLAAAAAMNKPRLSYCGVDELLREVTGFDFHWHRPETTAYDWGCYPLSKDLAKLATVNVYSYYMIGSTLLASRFVWKV